MLPAYSAGTNVDVPVAIAFALWEDRERICDWMPWIRSVKVRLEALDMKSGLKHIRTQMTELVHHAGSTA